MSEGMLVGGTLIVILVLLGASAFFSGSETSLMSANRIRMRRNAEAGDARAKKVMRAVESPERTITTILIGNNIVNVSAASLATFLAVRLFGDLGVAIATGVMTFVLLVFGEITPKVLGSKHPDYLALHVAGPLEAISRVLAPLAKFFQFISENIIRSTLGTVSRVKGPSITEDEIKMLAHIGAAEGVIEAHEKEIIQKVFEFTDKRASDVMHPRSSIVALEEGEPLSKAVSVFRKHNYSSMPVYRQGLDNITGLLQVKEMLKFEAGELGQLKVGDLAKPIIIASGQKRVPFILEEMRDRGINIAVVLDGKRKVCGIISIEDLLEEIVGNLHNELEGDAS